MFKKILVPYDSSKPSDKAAKYAVDLAKHILPDSGGGCEIILLHVVPEIPASPVFLERPVRTKTGEVIPLSEYIKRLYVEMKAHAAEMLEKKKKDLEPILNAKATIRTIVLIGDPVSDKIVELAGNEKVDIVVIGNVGLSGISKLKTLGSVSRGVSERASCPVLIVH
ncbi:universal stress protein [Nitrososphaera viennensis]|uniref:Universal stress protein n=2 Tax=Nitrososphaera viennensis TaxID=1034015 RepID=A0A977IEI7_9ARCH|nr:universal stress protein [Nitrososphaera viennensis]AIC14605.1 putative UspA domain protein [Nitrososphaera viennensis EN76]UVS69569.1 universal stress protein [Nitrososphaera viennensis]